MVMNGPSYVYKKFYNVVSPLNQQSQQTPNNPIPQSVMYQQLPDGQIQVYKLPTGVVPVLVSSEEQKQLFLQPQQLETQPQQPPQQQQLSTGSRRNSQDAAEAVAEPVVDDAAKKNGPVAVVAVTAAAAAPPPPQPPQPAKPREEAEKCVAEKCGQCQQLLSNAAVTTTMNNEQVLRVPQNTPVHPASPAATTPAPPEAVKEELDNVRNESQTNEDLTTTNCQNENSVSFVSKLPIGKFSPPDLSCRYVTPLKVMGNHNGIHAAPLTAPILDPRLLAQPPAIPYYPQTRIQLVFGPPPPPDVMNRRKNSLPGPPTKLNIYPTIPAVVDPVLLRRGSLPVTPVTLKPKEPLIRRPLPTEPPTKHKSSGLIRLAPLIETQLFSEDEDEVKKPKTKLFLPFLSYPRL